MSEMPKQEEEHTPGIWVVQQTANGPRIVALGTHITTGTIVTGTEPNAKANARRIVACVNACHELHTAYLENGGLAADLQGERRGLYRLREVTKQRDELLALLQRGLRSGTFDDLRMISRDVRAAIAKAANSR